MNKINTQLLGLVNSDRNIQKRQSIVVVQVKSQDFEIMHIKFLLATIADVTNQHISKLSSLRLCPFKDHSSPSGSAERKQHKSTQPLTLTIHLEKKEAVQHRSESRHRNISPGHPSRIQKPGLVNSRTCFNVHLQCGT